jgi:predicted nucleotidyltransferase
MEKEAVLELLRGHMDELRAMGVRTLSVFGSVARGEAGPESDVDILIDTEPGVTLFGLARIHERLESFLGCRVDLATRDALRERMRDRILAEAVRAA